MISERRTSVGRLCEHLYVAGAEVYAMALRADSWPLVERWLRCRGGEWAMVAVAPDLATGGVIVFSDSPFAGEPAREMAAALDMPAGERGAARMAGPLAGALLMTIAHLEPAGPVELSDGWGRIAAGLDAGATEGFADLTEF